MPPGFDYHRFLAELLPADVLAVATTRGFIDSHGFVKVLSPAASSASDAAADERFERVDGHSNATLVPNAAPVADLTKNLFRRNMWKLAYDAYEEKEDGKVVVLPLSASKCVHFKLIGQSFLQVPFLGMKGVYVTMYRSMDPPMVVAAFRGACIDSEIWRETFC